jgi:hypothetical protein
MFQGRHKSNGDRCEEKRKSHMQVGEEKTGVV